MGVCAPLDNQDVEDKHACAGEEMLPASALEARRQGWREDSGTSGAERESVYGCKGHLESVTITGSTGLSELWSVLPGVPFQWQGGL